MAAGGQGGIAECGVRNAEWRELRESREANARKRGGQGPQDSGR